MRWLQGCVCAQTDAAALRKQLEELRTQLQRNEEMVRWLNNQVRGWSDMRSARTALGDISTCTMSLREQPREQLRTWDLVGRHVRRACAGAR